MSSTSSARRAPSSSAAAASSPGQKRARDEASSGSPSDPDPAKNPRRAFASSPFADFGSYMAAKNSKLAAQFDADASISGAAAGCLFAGVSIFVDGFTVPSSQELKEIMLNNGGRFVNYFSRHTVTHIVCSNLPDSKMKNLRAFSKGLPVVKPAWVVDSLAENRLLNCAPYQINQNSSSSRKQMKLSSFFSEKQNEMHHKGGQNNKNKDIEFQSSSAQEGSQYQSGDCESEASMDNVELSKDSLSSDEQKASASEERESRDFTVDEGEYDCETACSESRNDTDDNLGVPQSPDAKSRCSNLCSTSSTGSHVSLPLEKSAAKPSGRPHSTLTDPNFVENYFKYSRLHFIGTWRNRYRKRFSNLLEAKVIKSSADHSGKKKTIIHIDMDCFFVSVVIRNMPELHDKPVAVCHSDNPKGTAEISSANYPARNYGIKAGMFVRDAKARCPHLMIVPYNFDAYEEVADQFYGTLHKHCSKVQALSCDEAFLDMTECLHDNPEEVTQRIRSEIFHATKCTASAGIAENMLLARLATRSAKPNGQCFIPSEKDALHKDFGKKTGDLLWNYCRGIDHSVVGSVQETKSVGAEINWGVRFNDNKDAEHFLTNLCKEVSLRLQGCGVQGRTVTLKVKTRREGAGEPIKYMGCGDCETTSRSMTIAGATDSFITLQRIAKQLFSALRLDVKEVRGIGLSLSKLEHADLGRGAPQGNMLESWLASPAVKLKKHHSEMQGNVDVAGTSRLQDLRRSGPSHTAEVNVRSDRSTVVHNIELPPLSQLDLEVLKNLPPEIISEMNEMYKGELQGLVDTLNSDKGKGNSSKSLALPAVTCDSVPGDAKLHGYRDHEDSMHSEEEHTKGKSEEQLSESKAANNASCSRASALAEKTTKSVTQLDLMPDSLSQADLTVLQELPEDVKADLFSALPLHRSGDPACSTSNVSESKSLNVVRAENRSPIDGGADDPENPRTFLPPGSSQKWIEQFRVSSCLILNVIAEQHTDSSCQRPLSSVLEPVASFLPLCPNSGSEEWNETHACLSELLRHYIQLKVEDDIEELYKCFCLLKRFSSASEFFLELHDSILPFLQDSVSQHYGGTLQF
ncbi:DNA repair protein REV1 isoform X2 [Sorghum bicolor]|uniref:DNA repair protein REV1 isoform X2 n=1 Tax=Sorghum bicolor TaxID=4558 RepID=UPI000B4249D6|nr:DNA repair protein REV1 isoform X2 [Sorghum bicolor]|eukprot:XP_021305826.1 DNA repair protein REV1 isoform X2 [Sorghum bicolor]